MIGSELDPPASPTHLSLIARSVHTYLLTSNIFCSETLTLEHISRIDQHIFICDVKLCVGIFFSLNRFFRDKTFQVWGQFLTIFLPFPEERNLIETRIVKN